MDFGIILEFKSEPDRSKIALNIAAQDEHQKQTLSDRLLMDFGCILASNLGPRSAQDLPSWSQDRLKTPNFGAKISPEPPTWSQDGPKTRPRPEYTSKTNFWGPSWAPILEAKMLQKFIWKRSDRFLFGDHLGQRC